MSLREQDAGVEYRPTAHLSHVRAALLARRDLLFPLLVFIAIRLADVLLMLLASRHQGPLLAAVPGYAASAPMPASPGYPEVAANWDGQWYQRIARDGYPAHLPIGPHGQVAQNAWAFYPLYPFTVRLLMTLTGLGFASAAAAVSLGSGLVAVGVLYVLLRERVGQFAARATVLLLCTYVAGPVMAAAYTESMALLLVCLALLLLTRRRYIAFLPVVTLLAMTRPVALALAAVVLVHGLVRYRNRAADPFPARERWFLMAAGAACVGLSGLWPLVAWLVTGQPSAYLLTMRAWPAYGRGPTGSVFIVSMWRLAGPSGLALTALVLFVAVAVVLRRRARAWGPEIRSWALGYPLYLLMTTAPSFSILRYGLLAFPMMWPLPAPIMSTTERRAKVALVILLAVAGLAAQWLWLRYVFVISGDPGAQPFP